MAKFQITQIKSDIGGTERQRQTLLSLGLRKIGDTTDTIVRGLCGGIPLHHGNEHLHKPN